MGSLFTYPLVSTFPNEHVSAISKKYSAYMKDYKGAMARLEKGEYTIFESRYSMDYLIRNKFTNM